MPSPRRADDFARALSRLVRCFRGRLAVRPRPLPSGTRVGAMAVSDSTCVKVATVSFAVGVAAGFLLNTRLRRWLNGY